MKTLLGTLGKIIADTNQQGRWSAASRPEKQRREKEAFAILQYLAKNALLVDGLLVIEELESIAACGENE